MNLNKIELLVPCGTKEAFYTAVKNGADAVYLGGKNFGARAFADNFDHDDMIEVINYAHLYGVKVYVTMNTLLSEDEIMPAIKEAEFLYKHNVDALIVQDLGLIAECLKRFPDLELHASTQMNINNTKAALNASKLGLKRIVLARETSLEVIQDACQKGLDIEVFAHGALCISYSGQCLMSSALFSRSGNKGTCAQCCRLQYHLYDKNDQKFIKLANEYLLSPKDLNTLKHIPDFIKAGVTSLKIEGRMKRKEYVGLVTRIYRKAIDAYYNGQEFEINDDMIKELKLMFNRGFTEGYAFKANAKDIYNGFRPNHMGVEIAKVTNYKDGLLKIKLNDDLSQGDGLRILDGNKEYGLIANKIYKDGLLVNGAKKGDIIAFDYREKISKDALIFKTTDIKLLDKINKFDTYRKVNISLYFEALLNKTFKLYLKDEDGHEVFVESSDILEAALKRPTDEETIIRQLSKVNDTAYQIKNIEAKVDNIFMSIKLINELRREAIDKLNNLRMSYKDKIINETYNEDITQKDKVLDLVEISNLNQYEYLKDKDLTLCTSDFNIAKDKDILYVGNNINEYSKNIDIKHLDSELGSINDASEAFYYGLNISNSYALAKLLSIKNLPVILSSELNEYQLNRLIDEFNKRYGFIPNIYYFAYGKRDLMFIKNSFLDNEVIKNINLDHKFDLVDYKDNHFPLIINSDGLLKILENEALSNDFNLGINKFYRFSDEDINTLKTIL